MGEDLREERADSVVKIEGENGMESFQDIEEEPDHVKDWREETIADQQEMWELMVSDDEPADHENEGTGVHYDTYDLGE